MRSISLRVAAADVEAVLDVVLPLAPRGVHELRDDGEAELLLFGEPEELPTAEALGERCGGLVRGCVESDAPDDWRARRLLTYRPRPIARRIVVRPEWAPAPAGGFLDVIVAGDSAFGTGVHPTTRSCLEALLSLEPRGALCDLGCGSGVLAIAAARLGFEPVSAVDVRPASVAATEANAELNRVAIVAEQLDLIAAAPPLAETMLANVPVAVHEAVAARLPGRAPERLVASGVAPDDVARLEDAYRRAGLGAVGRRMEGDWAMLTLEARR